FSQSCLMQYIRLLIQLFDQNLSFKQRLHYANELCAFNAGDTQIIQAYTKWCKENHENLTPESKLIQASLILFDCCQKDASQALWLLRQNNFLTIITDIFVFSPKL